MAAAVPAWGFNTKVMAPIRLPNNAAGIVWEGVGSIDSLGADGLAVMSVIFPVQSSF